jgi:hypothetical protein
LYSRAPWLYRIGLNMNGMSGTPANDRFPSLLLEV